MTSKIKDNICFHFHGTHLLLVSKTSNELIEFISIQQLTTFKNTPLHDQDPSLISLVTLHTFKNTTLTNNISHISHFLSTCLKNRMTYNKALISVSSSSSSSDSSEYLHNEDEIELMKHKIRNMKKGSVLEGI